MYKVYGFETSDRSGKVCWLLDELGIPYQRVNLDAEKKDHEAPAYLKLNPLGVVPTLIENERPLIESLGISLYLADKHADRGLAPALTSPLRAEYCQWMAFSVAALDLHAERNSAVKALPDSPEKTAKTAAIQSSMDDALDLLERHLASREFLLGGTFSAADVQVGYYLYWREKRGMLKTRPNLSAYYARLKTRPAAIQSRVFGGQ